MEQKKSQTKSRPMEIKPLTSIRIFGALWVLLLHMAPLLLNTFPFLDFLNPVFYTGFYGVNFFFIISGFVIWYVYGEAMSARFSWRDYIKFIANRIARLWPVNIVASFFVLAILRYSYANGEFLQVSVPDWYNKGSFLATVLMVGQWKPHIDFIWNQPAWTVSVEFLGYFLFPFIAILISRYLNKFPASLLMAIASLMMFLHLQVIIFQDDWAFCWVLRWLYWFMVGVLLSMVYMKIGQKKWKVIGFLHYLLPFLLIVLTLTGWWHLRIDYLMPCLGFWIFVLAVGESHLSKFLSLKFMTELGSTSYCLYMIHWGIIIVFSIVTYTWHVDQSNFRFLVPLLFISIFFISWVIMKLIEEPGRVIIKNIVEKCMAYLFP